MRAPLWNETNKSQSQQKRRQVRRVLLAGWTMSETLLRMVWWRLDEALNAPTMTRGQTGSPCCVLHTIGDTKEANHSNDSAHFDNTRRRATWFKYSLDNNETIWNITAAGRCWTLWARGGIVPPFRLTKSLLSIHTSTVATAIDRRFSETRQRRLASAGFLVNGRRNADAINREQPILICK